MRTLVIALVAATAWQGSVAFAQTSTAPAGLCATTSTDDWRRGGGPILFGGSCFFPSGPTVFFEGSVMVRTGSINGVPIYVDATHDPANVVYVPVAGDLMRPYERRRADQLAEILVEPTPPPAIVDSATPPVVRIAQAPPVDAAPAGNATASAPAGLETARRPLANRGIWIAFDGKIWIAAGAGGAYWPGRFTRIGTYHGFPVYQEPSRVDHIYVPSVPGGPVARYSLSDERASLPIE